LPTRTDTALRYLYTLALYLALPWVLLRLWRRGAADPGYRWQWRQRLGFDLPRAPRSPLWLHAVSVGEVRAALPLLKALRAREPDLELLITTTTPTGRATAQRLLGERAQYAWLPYDLPGAVRRFVEQVRPRQAVIMETEIWPNLYHALARRGITLFLVNARLSHASLRGYRRVPGLSAAALRCVTAIAAQSDADAERFVALGADRERVTVTGNLKFDALVKEDFAQRVSDMRVAFGDTRTVWIAGSTHAGEERPVLEAHRHVLRTLAGALLILVPRHPQRSAEVAQLCRNLSLHCRLYSEIVSLEDAVQVVIVDTLGDLEYLYGLAQVAFIGGSLVAAGGHNPIEALLAGAAVISGPHTDSFADACVRLQEAGALGRVRDERELARTVGEWLADEQARERALVAGQAVVHAGAGATQRTLALLGYAV
jgi:3-deoxy-D-manno-octulosonic-acid transferase